MDDATEPSPGEKAQLYLETLRLRMDPEPYRVLGEMLQEIVRLVGSPGRAAEQVPAPQDEEYYTDEVRDELMVLVAILLTGRMDQHIVNVGSGFITVVDSDALADESRMSHLRDQAAERRRRSNEQEAVLRGIEDATRQRDDA
ncbi:hypothetical protein C7C46_04740 [Streptomyces tateyamensis]|uniref:Uncharacterized protein n=1 Tax=Streptomyces tateyamensis TaxID=565073 RepID=A0A2V4P9J2_9ACTN|nr:hypothetical protein [Streptomyces tateyamensis]PYC87391.1 hypothetical protein C7C46_04740 [Streptomyces tateyamensis]